MDSNKESKTVFDHFDKAELELLRSDSEYAKKFIEEEGFKLDEELSYSKQYIKRMRFMAIAVQNKINDQHLLESTYVKLKESIAINATKATDALISSLQSKRPALQYRKLDQWTDDEIRDVLADVDLIELMEELEKNA